MEVATREKTTSRVPHHLRQFHPSSRGCPGLVTTPPYSYSFAPSRPADPVELCPPHWRLPEKHRVKAALRAILLKDWQSLQSLQRASRQRTPERPTMVRIKDSDDYITARAANPRTGLISPSVGSPSPHLPLTPESPAEALRLRKSYDVPSSPTPDAGSRPALRRANEGKKVSARDAWRASSHGWVTDSAATLASTRVANVKAGAGLTSAKAPTACGEDQFVVKMPSAREPQPYAFPGYSAKQIEAFEHYKQKARTVSSEGYDQRIVAAREPSGGKVCPGAWDDQESEHHCSHNIRAFAGDPAPMPNRDITVIKRRARKQDTAADERNMPCISGAELGAANFALFSSLQIPATRCDELAATSLTTFESYSHQSEALKVHKPIGRRPDDETRGTADLRSLPQVNLVHPTAACKTRTHHLTHGQGDTVPRKCSFGSTKECNRDVCISSGVSTLPGNRIPLFESPPVPDPSRMDDGNSTSTNGQHPLHVLCWLSDVLIGALVSTFELCRHVSLPQVRMHVFEVLRAEDTTAEQKVAAMKSIVRSTGQALGLITAVVMVWKLGGVFIQMLQILFWPLTVPIRLLRWLNGA